VLELSCVDTYYGQTQILRNVSLGVEEGKIVALLGRNGMGKTTTVRSIMGLTPPQAGTIMFDGTDISRLKPFRISRLGVGLVPQGRQIFASLSVRENLTMGMRGEGFSLDKIYEYFPVLEARSDHKGNQLSGGEQQMLAIARALLANPKLLLLDEPSEGLAPRIVQEVGEIILKLKEMGLSVLLVEQNLSLALGVSDYTYVMHRGEIVYEGLCAELAQNDAVQCTYIGVSGRGQTAS
jgi:branched-chain amino acid transport system ATP-binding protein